jgi:hypothetical protein
MNNHAVVNFKEHKNIKVNADRSAELGDNLWFTQVFPSELRRAQSCYPLFFQKDETSGKFFTAAVFGFEEGENLYLQNNEWDAAYVPMMVLRQPFLIGRQISTVGGEEQANLVVNIDLDNPRVNAAAGSHLFSEFGEPSPYLSEIMNLLHAIHEGVAEAEHFIQALLSLALLEPVVLSVTLNDSTVNELVGFYTINEEKLNALSAGDLFELQRKKYLEYIYMILASHSHINYLITAKNKKLLGHTC